MKSSWTLSNFLSFSRILLLVPFLYFLSQETPGSNYIALLIGVVGIATDFLDGYFARKHDTVTTLGKYLDPIADKICVFAAAIYLSYFRKNLAEWFTLLLIFKDLLIIIGGSYLVIGKKINFQSDMAGKWAVCFIAFTFVLLILNFNLLGRV